MESLPTYDSWEKRHFETNEEIDPARVWLEVNETTFDCGGLLTGVASVAVTNFMENVDIELVLMRLEEYVDDVKKPHKHYSTIVSRKLSPTLASVEPGFMYTSPFALQIPVPADLRHPERLVPTLSFARSLNCCPGQARVTYQLMSRIREPKNIRRRRTYSHDLQYAGVDLTHLTGFRIGSVFGVIGPEAASAIEEYQASDNKSPELENVHLECEAPIWHCFGDIGMVTFRIHRAGMAGPPRTPFARISVIRNLLVDHNGVQGSPASSSRKHYRWIVSTGKVVLGGLVWYQSASDEWEAEIKLPYELKDAHDYPSFMADRIAMTYRLEVEIGDKCFAVALIICPPMPPPYGHMPALSRTTSRGSVATTIASSVMIPCYPESTSIPQKAGEKATYVSTAG